MIPVRPPSSPSDTTSQPNAGTRKARSKRSRPVLSCTQCRRRKLKCDRTLPCNQCLKGKRRDQCKFPHGSDEQARDCLPNSPESQVALNEGSPQHTESDGPSVPPQCTAVRGKPFPAQTSLNSLHDQWPPGLLKVFEEETSYLGVGHWRHLVCKFNQVDQIMTKSLQDGSLRCLREKIESLFKFFEKPAKRPTTHNPELLTFLCVLPPKHVCDRLVEVYFEHLEGTLRLLHASTYSKECEAFWTNKYASTVPWAAQYLAVLTIGLLFDTSGPMGLSASDRLETAESWLDLSESWLKDLHGSMTRDINAVRALCLHLMTIQAIPGRRDIQRSNPGNLLSTALSAGFHREPRKFPELSEFNCEIRRRLWASVTELTINYALVFNYPPLIRENDFDTTAPSNIDDSVLFELMLEPCDSQPADMKAEPTFQNILAQALPIRLKALEAVHKPPGPPKYETVISISSHMEQILARVPHSLSWKTHADGKNPGKLYQALLLDVYIRRALLTLHFPYILKIENPIFGYSRKVAVDSACTVLSYLDVLAKSSPRAASVREALQNELVMDFFLASLVLCLEIRTVRNEHAAIPTPKPRYTNSNAVRQNVTSYESTAPEKRIPRLEDLVDQALENFYSRLPSSTIALCPLYLSMVFNSVKSKGSPQVAEILIKKDLHRIVAIMQTAQNAGDAAKPKDAIALPDLIESDGEFSSLAFNFEPHFQNDIGLFSGVPDGVP